MMRAVHRARRSTLSRWALLIGALALLLAACGAEDVEDQAQTGEEGNAEERAADEGETDSDYPQQDIRLVVPFSAGGGYDTQARLIAPFLQRHLPNDVNIVVDNMPGGEGILGPQTVYNAEPDGYMILQAGVNSLLIAQVLNPDVITYDMTQFRWIGQYQEDVRGVAVSNDLDVETWDDLSELSQEQPLRVGGTGLGSPPSTEAIALSELTGLQIDIIEYEGSAEVQAAFARGEVDLAIVNYTSILRWQDDGDARLFLVMSEQRGDYAPDVPTAVEAGMDEELFQRISDLPVIGQPRMFAAPPGTSDDVLQILRDAFMDAMEDPEYMETVEEQQEIYLPLSGEEAEQSVQQIADRIQEEMDLIEQLYGE